jgi:hypothetical protein
LCVNAAALLAILSGKTSGRISSDHARRSHLEGERLMRHDRRPARSPGGSNPIGSWEQSQSRSRNELGFVGPSAPKEWGIESPGSLSFLTQAFAETWVSRNGLCRTGDHPDGRRRNEAKSGAGTKPFAAPERSQIWRRNEANFAWRSPVGARFRVSFTIGGGMLSVLREHEIAGKSSHAHGVPRACHPGRPLGAHHRANAYHFFPGRRPIEESRDPPRLPGFPEFLGLRSVDPDVAYN